ncbi:MAG: SAM-dependent methyltransferase [Motiliproteus sp.]|nr:SAM-dependent methyltransferase [Motiliproteus sp.]MCW9051551.1 SAM-dependent methyltransferase [Motiliproteus sp.]
MPNQQNQPNLSERFSNLNRLLEHHRDYWQFRPFSLRQLPWQKSNSELCSWLNNLSADQLRDLESNPLQAHQQLSCHIEDLTELNQLSELQSSSGDATNQSLPAWLGNHIPGRKWQQIQAFEQALKSGANQYLEWCSGKGHLGRLISFQRQKSVTSIEINPDLCQQGEKLAKQHQIPMRFKAMDALAKQTGEEISTEHHVVALHACGDLHLQLIRHSAKRQPRQLSISPCCYHLIAPDYYQPLSELGQASALRLDHHDLRLPLQQTVTAGNRINRLRHQEVSWRLGFDLLQRDLRGYDQYLNTPSIAKSLLNGSFAEYCRWMTDRKEIKIPAAVDFNDYELKGRQRYLDVQRMELVRHLFRRPLELWLVLDRALYLQQLGYRVNLQEFCDYKLTPRNILITAEKQANV